MHLSTQAPQPPQPRQPAKLGEELQIFCEKCGYSLNGLAQVRCEACAILQFQCPECGHHQPINTLRPAFQRILGRLRAAWLVWVVFFKLNYFGWLLFAWVAMGIEWSYPYSSRGLGPAGWLRNSMRLNWEVATAFAMFAIAFGAVSRMLLLRWRSGVIVGTVLALLVIAAVVAGVAIRSLDLAALWHLTDLWYTDWFFLLSWTFVCTILGAVIAWPIWVALVKAFLPSKTSGPLLEWQRSLSDKSSASLARD